MVRDYQPDDSHAERRPRRDPPPGGLDCETSRVRRALHFTAFHPDFKLRDKPATPPETLHRARAIAREAGLHYVYEGNIHSGSADTDCPGCGAKLIRRSWHSVIANRLKGGACPNCGRAIPGRWTFPSAGTTAPSGSRASRMDGYDDLNL